jgi:hypothetical protein
MTRSISFRCPSCRARIKAPIGLMGQTRSCPGCGNRFVVRLPIPEDSGPVILMEANSLRSQKSVGLPLALIE